MKLSPKQYASVLFDLTDGKSGQEIKSSVADFARYIHRNRKLKLADKIAEQFVKIYNAKNGIVEAEVVSRKKMDEQELKKVRGYVAEKYEAKEVILKNMVEENVKGGIVLKVGDEIIDNSIAGKISELKKVLVS